MTTLTYKPGYFRKQIAIPQDHGSWVFLLSPLLIGLFVANSLTVSSVFLIVAAFSGFLIRQPITQLIKIWSGRRNRRDLPAAWFWTIVYFLVGIAAISGLVLMGDEEILLLAIPGIPVFLWHLYLISRRSERRQIGVEIVACGVLSLSAPAAYWVGMGGYEPLGWWLFILTWLQSAASIVYAYLRLQQRELPSLPELSTRMKMGRRSLMYTGFNLLAVTIFSITGALPFLLPLPYLVQAAETIWGTLHPAIGIKPTRIGLRQLFVSSLFTILFIVTWRISI